MRLSALLLLGLCSALFATPQGPVVPLSATRAEIVLNGAWRFEPAADGKKQPADDWGSIQVPGSWFPKRGSVPGILESGKSAVWKTINETTSAAWYERSIEIPADWAGREIEVNFERVSTEAIVFLDGKEAGKLEWPGGTVNLTRTAKPGRPQTLRLYVVATPDAVDLDYMGIGQNTARKATLETRGITGDVVLSCRPGGSWIGGIFIQPSVRAKNLKLTVEWSGKAPTAPVACEVVAKRWPGGEEAKRWTVELPAGAVSSVDCPWEDPQLWDYKQPNLYTLSVTTKLDSISERFGFREWRIDGRTLLLNEIPFRPQPVNLSGGWMTPPGFGNHRAVGALLDLQLDRSIGLGWEWPEKFFQRGKPFYQEALATVADEKGFPILGNLYRLNEFVNDAKFDNVWPQNQARWEKLTAAEWRKYRNHPSIVGWLLSGNLGPHHADQNPRFIGKSKWHTSETTQLLEGVKTFMHGIDPGRSVLFGAASWPGDIYSAMTYLNFTPLAGARGMAGRVGQGRHHALHRHRVRHAADELLHARPQPLRSQWRDRAVAGGNGGHLSRPGRLQGEPGIPPENPRELSGRGQVQVVQFRKCGHRRSGLSSGAGLVHPQHLALVALAQRRLGGHAFVGG